jgi:BlaR1 peptidase M56
MPSLILYIIKLSVALALIWGFYRLLLRGLTFYMLNRWYLVGYSILAFLFPLVNVEGLVDKGPAGGTGVVEYIPAIGQYMIAGPVHPAAVAVVKSPFDWSGAVLWVIGAGAIVLLIRVLVRWLSLVRIRKSATLVEVEGMTIYEVGEDIRPFSFGKGVYINPQLHTEKEWEEIILHEYVHIRQNHTLDILLAELVCILNWYNPFSWLMRRSIRQNLEFIADRQVLSSGVDRVGYQYHLLKVLGEPRYRLANNFNFSSLKKRIIMMNKMRSARLHLVKFLFVVPLAAVLLVAFRDKYADWWRPAAGQVYVNAAGIVVSADNLPVAGVMVREKATGLETTTDANGYYKLHIPVARTKDSIRIRLDYSKEGYDSDWRQHFIPSIKESLGMLDVGTIQQPSSVRKDVLMIIPDLSGNRPPADPDYEDALKDLHRLIRENKQLSDFLKMINDHPEVSLFYITEDKQRRIVVHTDGMIEKYGYPGEPSLEDMDKKYGIYPDLMTNDERQVSKGYMARWAGISARAEKAFHTTSTNVKAIIFPGDSRVIVVPVTGKPRFYDMDNGAEKERAEFESKYGPLPACVPAPEFNSDMAGSPVGAGSVGGALGVGGIRVLNGSSDVMLAGDRHWMVRSEVKDTSVPRVQVVRRKVNDTSHVPIRAANILLLDADVIHGHALYVLDGEKMPAGWKPDSMTADNIRSVDVVKGDEAVRLFGSRGANGVVAITTKNYELNYKLDLQLKDSIHLWNPNNHSQPLYILDGKEVPVDTINALNPNTIESISVHKADEATQKYGDKGKNGVIIIALKKDISIVALPDGRIAATTTTSSGPMTIIGDSMVIHPK